MPRCRLGKEQTEAIKAVRRVKSVVEEVSRFCQSPALDKRKQTALRRRIQRLIDIIAPTFLPHPLQEALERAHEALVACRLVIENFGLLSNERREELLSSAAMMAESALKVLEKHF